MRIRFRHRLTTLLLLPLLVGFGIKWCRGPHEYSLLGEHVQRVTEAEARDPSARYTVYQIRARRFANDEPVDPWIERENGRIARRVLH
jgi:hypothetical protein